MVLWAVAQHYVCMRVARIRGPSTYNVTSFTPFSNLPIQSLFHSHTSSDFPQFPTQPIYSIKSPCPHQNSRHFSGPVENCCTWSENILPGLLERNLIVVLVPNLVLPYNFENCLTWKKRNETLKKYLSRFVTMMIFSLSRLVIICLFAISDNELRILLN